MKNIQKKWILFLIVTIVSITSCTKDTDASVLAPSKTLFAENFDNTNNATSGYAFNSPGWTTYAQTGAKLWLEKNYKNDGYATFSTFGGASEPVSVTWLISPSINMDTQEGEKLFFQSCQDGYIRSQANSLELYVSTDYDGITFGNANWQIVNFQAPTQDTTKYLYVDSGIIDLSSYTGTLHFAFKVKGTSALTGGYQVDNVRVFY